jgi:predicted phage baseplate assembly protein
MIWWRGAAEGGGDPDAQPVEDFPDLLDDTSRAIRGTVAARIGAFTPDWKVAAADAGVALVKVFGEQAEPVAQRANRLREKYAREQLRIAGVRGRGPRAGLVQVVVSLLETAPEGVLVPAATQLTATGAGGTGQVVFETVRDLWATPSRLRMLVTQAGTHAARLEPAEVTPQAPAQALGRQPQPGNALWLGFAGPVPLPRLALAFELVAEAVAQPSVVAGDGRPRQAGEPALGWELLTDDGLVPAEVHADETRALRQSGIVEVGTVRDWPALRHPGLLDAPPETELRWLRVGLLFGRYESPPRVAAVRVNAVMAEGVETVRDEVLEPVEEPVRSSPARRFRLSRTPVLRGTVRLVVDAPDPADLFDVAPARPAERERAWVEVPTLVRSHPYDQHFVVDESSGVVTFGDGVYGAAVPEGFRHVRAVSYRTGGGRATALRAAVGLVPRQTIPFLSGIDNPAPAAGAADGEPVDDLVARGPALVRARGRAVTPADLEALAVAASGEIGRVVAVAGADLDGTRRPGQVTVVVVGARRDDGRAPVPTEATLGAVARLLVDAGEPVAPLGARVVVRAARFVPVTLEVALRPDEDADRAALAGAVARAVDGHLDPLTGGEDGRGWPLGQPLGWRRLVSVVAAVPGVASVGRVGVVVAGRPSGACRDAPLPPCTLPWPGHHLILPVEVEGGRS